MPRPLFVYLILTTTLAFAPAWGTTQSSQQSYKLPKLEYPATGDADSFIKQLLKFQALHGQQRDKPNQKQFFAANFQGDISAKARQRLNNFADALLQNNWPYAVIFFKAEHFEGQLDMYLTDSFMFGGLGDKGLRSHSQVLELYLGETIGLFMQGKNIDSLYDIESIKFLRVMPDEYADEHGLKPRSLDIEFEAIQQDGRRERGVVTIIRRTLLLTGAVG